MSILQNKQELFQPIKEYWEYVGCKDIKVFDETNQLLQANKLINKYNKFIDNACYHTINYFDNINLLMCINLSKKQSFEYYQNKLQYDFRLYGIKTINIPFDLLPKILYQIQYQHITNYYELMNEITKDYPFFEKYNKEDISVNILMLVNKSNMNLVLENEEEGIIIYSNTKYKKKIISSIFYNENSLKFIEMQNIQKLLSNDFKDNLKEFHNIKEEILKYSYFTQENIMVCSSSILMLLGLRKNNDIDLYIDVVKEKEEIFNKFSKINNIDFKIKNTDTWPTYWNKWLDEWAQICGAKYFEEIVGLQDYHFYYCGIKFMGLNVDIQRRIKRNRPAALTDLMMLNRIYNLNITIPKIPDIYYEFKNVEFLTEKEKDKLLEEGAIYDADTREYKIEKKTNHSIYMKRMQDYFKNRYDIDINLEDIRNVVSVKKKIKLKIKK